ncbi:trypsin-1-like [Penaeus chinensis]|uniref:trypsin-1-like n=1 Tax=Penaeus chinensis TaxID=139456 RepID=UPI001FB5EE35|nr:trypsin-1-like [Penaeus chinensis]
MKLSTSGKGALTPLMLCLLTALTEGSPGQPDSNKPQRLSMPCITPKMDCDPHQVSTYLDDDDKIIGGKVTEPGTTPWLVSLKDSHYADPVHFCGGTVISHAWVLTSASCVAGYSYPYTYLQVVAGEYDLDEAEGWEQVRKVTRMEVHPEYDLFTQNNDVALLRVFPWFLYNERVAPLPLPPTHLQGPPHFAHTHDNEMGLIAGWGRTAEVSEISHLVLMAYAPLLSTEDCVGAYGEAITASMMCAGNLTHGGLDPCQGDWGGGLKTREGYLLGVSSWGTGCGRPGLPAVYTNVQTVRDWICSEVHCITCEFNDDAKGICDDSL